MMRRSKIMMYSIFSFINLTIFIILLMRDNAYKLIFYLTLHSFWSNCFYFLTCLILEIRAEWKNTSSETFLPFMQNTYFKYSFTYTCFITSNFYLFVLLGSNFMKFSDNAAGIFFSIFLHGGEFIFVLIEFYVSQHSFIPSYGKDFAVIKLYFSFYLIISIIALNSNIYPYEFMKVTSNPQNFVIYFVSFILLVNFYMIYQWLAYRKNQNMLSETISIIRTCFSEDTNSSSINKINDKEMNFLSDIINEKNLKSNDSINTK